MRLSVQIEFDRILDLEFQKTSVIVGRSEACDIIIPHKGISRRHCKIELEDNKFYITDLDSSNGVFINGQKIPPNERLPLTADFSLGKLDCEIGKKPRVARDNTDNIVSTTVDDARDYTQTIRLARLDINREIISTRKLTLEPSRPKGPRNPITSRVKKKEPEAKKPYFLLLILMAVAIYLFRDKLL
jgi:hypothetical protein